MATDKIRTDAAAEWWEQHGPEAAFSSRLRTLRHAQGLSQQDIADKMREFGYSWYQTTVAKIERGARPIRLNEAVALATMFDIPPAELLVAPPSARPEDPDKELRSLLDRVRALEALVQASRRKVIERQAQADQAVRAVRDAHEELRVLETDLNEVRRSLDEAIRMRRHVAIGGNARRTEVRPRTDTDIDVFAASDWSTARDDELKEKIVKAPVPHPKSQTLDAAPDIKKIGPTAAE